MKVFSLILAFLVIFSICKKAPKLTGKLSIKKITEDIIDELSSVMAIEDDDAEEENDEENGFFGIQLPTKRIKKSNLSRYALCEKCLQLHSKSKRKSCQAICDTIIEIDESEKIKKPKMSRYALCEKCLKLHSKSKRKSCQPICDTIIKIDESEEIKKPNLSDMEKCFQCIQFQPRSRTDSCKPLCESF